MTTLHPVNTMRGVNLPDGIEPDFMYQVGGDACLMVHDVKGSIYCRKGDRWYKMVEFTPKKAKPGLQKQSSAPALEPTA